MDGTSPAGDPASSGSALPAIQQAVQQFKMSMERLINDAVGNLERELAAIAERQQQQHQRQADAAAERASSGSLGSVAPQTSVPLTPVCASPATHTPPSFQAARGLIHLSVGGQHFSTSLATISQQSDSMLAAMFSGRHQTATDTEGRVFIDRDGELFRHVLAFLREGEHWQPPSDESLWKRLQREFQFYGLVTGFELPESASNGLAEEDRHPVQPAVQFIYAIGGASSTANMERYSADGDRWDSLPGPAEPVHTYMGAAALGGNLYVLGGKSMNGPLLDNVFVYSPQGYAWRGCAGLTSARAGLAGVGCAGAVYALGGKLQGSQYLDIVERYDPGADVWTQIAPMSTPRDGLAAVEMDGAVYALGGKPSYNSYLNTMERYDPREGRWTTLVPMRLRRQGLMAVTYQERIFAMGGYADSSCFREVETFDPRAGTWAAGPALFEARYAGAAAVVGGSMYVLGGWNGNRELSSVERLEDDEARAGFAGRWKPGKSMIRPRQFLAAAAL